MLHAIFEVIPLSLKNIACEDVPVQIYLLFLHPTIVIILVNICKDLGHILALNK